MPGWITSIAQGAQPCQIFTWYGSRPDTATLNPIRHMICGTSEFCVIEPICLSDKTCAVPLRAEPRNFGFRNIHQKTKGKAIEAKMRSHTRIPTTVLLMTDP
jgi:hypothetical protein